jgi:hypothetical protein
MIAVYQWNLSEELSDLVNAEGWLANETTKAYADKGCSWLIDNGEYDAAAQYDAGRYELVALVNDTTDLEEAFMLMNVWPEPDRITKIGARVASLSIGDILETNGQFFVCGGEGFREIFPKYGDRTIVAAG